jgi:hypothetical protein
MTRHLNVLVAESHPGLAASDIAALEAAGHTVHRCYEPGQRGFPCTAVHGKPCPLDGPIDVAYLHRLPMTPRATPLEDGVRCAVRQDVPVVEHGSSLLDPFEPFVDAWVADGDVVATIEEVAEHRYDPLQLDVLQRIGPLLQSAGISADHVSCRVVPEGLDVDIRLVVDAPEDPRLDAALSVRALDAVRAGRQRFGHVGVSVDHRPV